MVCDFGFPAFQRTGRERVTSLADSQLWVALPALASPWTQSQKTAHVPALLEATRVFDGQQVCQRRDGALSGCKPYGRRFSHFCIDPKD